MVHKQKGLSVLHAKLKPLYWAMLPLMLFGTSQYATAATVYWDGTDTTSGNGAPIGGTGTWNTTTTNWTNNAAGTTNQAWVAGDNAIFGGIGGTVTLGEAQTVGDITFSTDGYRLTNTNATRGIFFANPINSYTVTNIGDTATISTIIGYVGGTSPNALIKLGDGKLILADGNNYSGDTTVSAGTLEVQTFMIKGNLINNGSFIYNVNGGGGSFYSNNISGSGTLTKTGTYFLSLSGASTYTGDTIISGGTIRAANATALGNNSAVTVANPGKLELNSALTIGSLAGSGNVILGSHTLSVGGNNTSTSHSGVISGTGALIKNGTGIQTLSGANTYSGGTTIASGTLQIGNGGTAGSISGNITNDSALIFNRSDTLTYADVISGAGSFTQAGTGNTNLTGANTYNGVTTINSGTLSVNGSIANSSTTVNTGGTLGGSGTVGHVTINSGGTFAPGNSIGTINVTGDVVFSAGSNYNVEVDAAGNSDKIIATGTATLTGATVNVQPEAGTYAVTTDYTILTAAGGLGGTTFGSVNSNLAFLTPTLSYDANNVLLNLTRNDISFNSVASTPNQTAVSAVLDNNTTALQSIVSSIIPLTDTGAQQAFDSLSGVQHTQSQAVMNKLGQQFQQLLFSRSSQSTNGTLGFDAQNFNSMQGYQLADNSNNWQIDTMDSSSLASRQRGWWMQGVGGFGSIDDTNNASGADYQSGGVALGMDTHWRDFVVGVAGSYTRSNVDPYAGDNDIESFQAGVYGSWERDNVYMNASVGLGLHKIDATRIVTVGSSVSTATSNYDSVNLSTALEAGKDIKLDLNTTLTPYVGVSYSHNNRDDFIETGAGTANLSVSEQDEDSLRTTLGLRLSRNIKTNNNKTITPAASIAYVREHLDSVSQFEAGFATLPTSTFKVDGSDLDQNRLQVGLGVTGQLNENTTLNVGYNGELAGSDNYHSFAATVRFVW